MDKNNLTGLLLISILLFTYFFFFSPEPPPQEAEPQVETGISENETPDNTQTLSASVTTEPDSVLSAKYGFFGSFMKGESQEYTLENKNLKILFDSKGGTVKEVLLKNYVTYTKEPLVLLDERSSSISEIIATNSGPIDLNTLFYNAKVNGNSIEFTASNGEGKSIKKIYTLPEEGFVLNYNTELSNLDAERQGSDVQFYWYDAIKRVEKSLERSRQRSTINYYTVNDNFDHLSETSTSLENEKIEEVVNWVSIKQKFFNASIISGTGLLQNLDITTHVNEPDQNTVKVAEVRMNIPDNVYENDLKFYFGPNDYDICEGVAPEFEKNVYLGWAFFSTINRFLIIPLFKFLESHIASYGIIILILVLIVKSLLFPLTYRSYISMAKMKVLKPEMDELKEKHGDDMAAMQKEQMKLYSRVGVNPLSGCIPMVAQMPVFLALFNFFPNAIQLRQQSFLWAEDLSTYDSIFNLPFEIPFYGSHVSLFTLLFTLSQLAYTYYNNQINTTVQGPMKSVGYIMPVTFMFFFNNFSAGLTYYYFVSNMITVSQQLIIRKFVDDSKIRKILDENKKKNQNKKKSKFQQRLEDAMKVQEESKGKKSTGTGNRKKGK
ncbi:membrane protein insertase YidC [Chondrinema litorale]|uniref:membrane protein insertase YidC n=1 Tax=Chondrinema litorale TaxID=2994555 RepID=UPI0025443BF6|nr:membrane protein insertase YidC [Chondrinema litorale]UZR93605.1 membrane protein insertase YidC [Chondrinema litorale]